MFPCFAVHGKNCFFKLEEKMKFLAIAVFALLFAVSCGSAEPKAEQAPEAAPAQTTEEAAPAAEEAAPAAEAPAEEAPAEAAEAPAEEAPAEAE